MEWKILTLKSGFKENLYVTWQTLMVSLPCPVQFVVMHSKMVSEHCRLMSSCIKLSPDSEFTL